MAGKNQRKKISDREAKMRTLVTYFSHSGHTEKVANILTKILRKKGEVDIQRLTPKKEIKNFLLQCRAAHRKEQPELSNEINKDFSNYDLVVIASPVWAFNPTPAINTFFSQVIDFKGKNIIILLCSGGKMLLEKCYNNIETTLKNKNAGKILRLNILDKQLNKEEEIIAVINQILSNL